jgi:copper chaperone NosL
VNGRQFFVMGSWWRQVLWRVTGSVVGGMLAALLLGCNGVDLDAPPEIVYGRDVCSRCGMIIEDARFAAAYVTPDGESRIFDDIGDMLVFQADEGEAVHVYWVHDYETGAWLRAEEAFFVLASDIHTPMGYGLVALMEEGAATAVALRNNGRVLTFTDLQQETTTLSAQHHGHDH